MKHSFVAFVIAMDGTRLMPCLNPKKVRKLLKSRKAVIAKYDPFTIQLTYETTNEVQPVELSVDTGEQHIGMSLKSEKHEYVHEQRDMLADEKARHDDQRRYRRTKRNRKRYRKARFDNRRIPKGWLAPSLDHKKEQHIRLCERYVDVAPVTAIWLETGQFDTTALHLAEQGLPAPSGTDYQQGPRFGYDNLREAVFYRDGHTCQICGSTIGKIKTKDGYKSGTVILRMHHIGYRTGDHTDRMSNLLTVCTRCHTSANHQPGGLLYDLKPKAGVLKGAAFMNTVRWYIVNALKNEYPNISVGVTYGSVTKRERLSRRMVKAHANDAYCIGKFHPKHKSYEVIYRKVRRNNRTLKRFYDAKVIDTRTGEKVSGSALGCGRTNRSESRRGENNLRMYRGTTVTKGYRSIRKRRHPYQAGDIVLYKGKKHVVKTCRTKYTKQGTYETVEFTDMSRQIRTNKTKIIRYIGAWKKVTAKQ